MRKEILVVVWIVLLGLWITNSAMADYHNQCAFTWISCGNPPCNVPPDEPPSVCNPCNKENCKGSPCYAKTGNYTTSSTDLHVRTVGPPLSVFRNYESTKRVDGVSGMGWSSTAESRISYLTYLFAAPSTYRTEADVFMQDGVISRFIQNTDGSFTAPAGNHDTLVRNGDGTWDLTLTSSRIQFHFVSTGELQSITDEFGNVQSWTYSAGRVQRITDVKSGRFINFYYGGDGRISAVQDSGGRQVQYFYDSQGLLTTMIDPANRTTTYTYSPARFVPLLTQIKDNWNRIITTMTYLPTDQLSTYSENGETYTFVYNTSSTRKTDTSGHSWTLNYDANGLITSRIGSPSTSDTYNPDGTIQIHTDEVGVKTLYSYNPNSTIASATRDYQGPLALKIDYVYDPNFPDKAISITPKNPSSGAINTDWQAWRFDYYQAGSTAPGALHHVYRVQGDGSTLDTLAAYTYNSAGQVLTKTDATGAITSYAYNGSTGDLVSATFPKNSDSGPNPMYQYNYDPLGRVTSVTDPLNHVTTYAYDNVDRITTSTLPRPSPSSPNFVTAYSYDNFDSGSGLVFTTETDPNGRVTKQGLDQFGQLGKTIDAQNNLTNLTYSKGLLTSSTDENGNTTSYTYTNGLLTTVNYPLTETVDYRYTIDGIFRGTVWPNGISTMITYDSLKRPIQESSSSNRLLFPTRTVNYTYTGQKLTRVSDLAWLPSYTYTYDPSYRVVSVDSSPSGGHVDYTYDPADRMTSYTVQGHASATKTYYPDGSLNTIAWSPVSGYFKYTYTPNGQYAAITFPNGQHRDYTYDDQDRLLQIANIHPATGNIAGFNYGYDIDNTTGLTTMLGHRTSVAMNIPSLNFANSPFKYYYDPNYQLIRVDYPNVSPFNGRTDSWTYDVSGNRLTAAINGVPSNYTYALYNGHTTQQLISDGNSNYTYDSAGNLAGIAGPQNHTYTWGANNKLSFVDKDGGTPVSYYYDYLGHRVMSSSSAGASTYLYDGENLILDNLDLGSVVRSNDFLFGPGIDEPLAGSYTTTIDGTTYTGIVYYDADGLGTVWGYNDPAGRTNSYVYDSWGNRLNAVTQFSFFGIQPFNFTARESSDAGLMYFRERYYNSSTGNFLSEDPIGLENGMSHLYRYASNDPIQMTDPLGLCDVQVRCRSVRGDHGFVEKNIVPLFGYHCYILVHDRNNHFIQISAGATTDRKYSTSGSGPQANGSEPNYKNDKCIRCDMRTTRPVPESCDRVDCLIKKARQYNDAKHKYDPLGETAPNSNSFVGWVMKQCGMAINSDDWAWQAKGCYYWTGQ